MTQGSRRDELRRLVTKVVPPETPTGATDRRSRVAHGVERVVDYSKRIVRASFVSYLVPFTYAQWSWVHRRDEVRRPIEDGEALRSTDRLTVAVLPGAGSAVDTLGLLRDDDWPHRVLDLSSTPGVGAALAAALDRSVTTHVVLLRAGDRLEPGALGRIAERAFANPEAQVLTWDDDVDSVAGTTDPRFRPPTWSPDQLLSANPYGWSVALRVDAARAAGVDADLGEDALWDLLLALDPAEQQAEHLPLVLGHLTERPPAVGPEATTVVARHLARLGLSGTPVRRGDAVHVRWDPAVRPKVSILVPTRHNRTFVGPLLSSLRTTDYPEWELVIVDNGGRSDENEAWYEANTQGIDHRVIWWDEPFNYGAVNNAAARASDGDVVILLNDDTVIGSPGWLDELVGWLAVPGVGTVGVQMIDPEGCIQHGGVIIGSAGLADHRFQGLAPHTETMIGSTDWYWDSTANTGACLALTRQLWDDIGGIDERFVLCGSDVVLGLDARHRGLRNVCTPAIRVDHLESATRGAEVPAWDIFHSYWPYARRLKAGDEYHSPNVSLMDRTPVLRAPDEPDALARLTPAIGRGFGPAFRQENTWRENDFFARRCQVDDATVAEIAALHARHPGELDVRTVNWFVPDFDNPHYGGIATIFRIADHLRRHHGVENRFVAWAEDNEGWYRSGLAAAFPGLADTPIFFNREIDDVAWLDTLPPADVGIATQWHTAYRLAHAPGLRRKAYLIQDNEAMFHPAGTLYALAEETYRMGLVGLCNTHHLLDFYRDRYDGRGHSFLPAVDDAVFHARDRPERRPGDPLRLFVYARPGHWRNCWELAEPALRAVKEALGDDVHIITAGAWARTQSLGTGIDHLGLLDYRDTGELYRTCDLALTLTVSEHPSYLPLELMACGVPVVAFDLPPGYWILRDGENCLLARRTVASLTEQLLRLATDDPLRADLATGALASIAASHASWDANLAGVHAALGAPLDPGGSEDEALA